MGLPGMNQLTVKTVMLLLIALLSACASKPEEKLNDNLFTYQDEQGKKYFSYVLEIKDQGSPSIGNNYTVVHKGSGNRRSTGRANQRPAVTLSESAEDDKVSIKYQMEEIAHEKLELALKQLGYCTEGVQYSVDQYQNYRYQIKGYCL